MNPVNYNFDTSEQVANALAQAVAGELNAAITARGAALLAVSGGTTPTRFFQALSKLPLAWENITVTLVDERWVPVDNIRSNERLVRANLLQGPAAAARFVPLYEAGASKPEEAILTVTTRIILLDLPFDVLLLGMGEDGHTASYFSDGDHLSEATNPQTSAVVLPMNSRSAGEPRITLTLPIVLASRSLYLHIEGERKRRIVHDAQFVAESNRAFPISTVLRNTRTPLKVYWCP